MNRINRMARHLLLYADNVWHVFVENLYYGPIKELLDLWHFIGSDNRRDFKAGLQWLSEQKQKKLETQKQAAKFCETRRQEALETLLKTERS